MAIVLRGFGPDSSEVTQGLGGIRVPGILYGQASIDHLISVFAEDRFVDIMIEDRLINIYLEDRFKEIGAENRFKNIYSKNRFIDS